MSRALKNALLTVAALSGCAAFAVNFDLSPKEARRAVAEGVNMVSPKNGYKLGDYVVHEYISDVRLKPDDPEVNAITLSTPYETLRNQGYYAEYQKKTLGESRINKLLAETKDKLTFDVYAHSPNTVQEELEQFQQAYQGSEEQSSEPRRQRSFLDQFSAATLTVGKKTLTAQTEVQGPYQDQFSTVGGKPEFRFIGVLHYTFDLSGMDVSGQMGTLNFKDSSGQTYQEKVVFDDYL